MDPKCDICRVEFPSSEPNPAVLDAPLAGGGPWAYFCEAHTGNAKRGAGTRLDTGKRDKREAG
jgi:hypothetical protein